MTKERPLVSIIVRTKDRPQLLELALKSIAGQTYRPLEVILVNDGGCDLDSEKLTRILGDVRLNYQRLERNTGRAHAANVGLSNAQGKYIGFLDDDDLLYEDHLTILEAILQKYPYQVAYSDANIAYIVFDPELQDMVTKEKRLFSSKNFSYRELIIDNYIPLMCILFSKDVFQNVQWFDESFDVYEDWDLLIRIAERYPFYHIKKVTAEYIQWSSTLQIAQSPEFIDKSHAAHIKIISKHRDKITSEVIRELVLKKRALQEKENTIGTLIGVKAGLEKVIQEKEEIIDTLEGVKSDLQEALGEKEHVITTLEEVQADLKVALSEKEEAVNTLQKVSSSFEKAQQEKEQALSTLEEVRLRFNKTLQEKEDILSTLDRVRKNFDTTLQEKERIVEILDGVRESFERALRGKESGIDVFEGVKQSFERALKENDYTISTLEGLKVNLEKTLKDKEGKIITLEEVEENFEKVLREKESTISALKEIRMNLERALQEKDNIITLFESAKASFDAILHEKISKIANLEDAVLNLEEAVQTKDSIIRDKDSVINEIFNSHGWKMLSSYYNFRDRVLPDNSKRRLLYDLFFLAFENPKGLLKSLNGYNIKRFFTQSKILEPSVIESKVRGKVSSSSVRGAATLTHMYPENITDLSTMSFAAQQHEGDHLLVIDRFVPTYDKDSGSLRMFTLLQILHELDFKITFLPDDLQRREPYVNQMLKSGIEVLYGNIDVEHYLQSMGSAFSFVVLSRPEQAFKYLPMIRAYGVNSTVIYDTVDLHWIRFERAASVSDDKALLKKAKHYKSMELFNASCSDIVFTVTQDEKEFLLKEDSSLNVKVMPNIHEVIHDVKQFEKRKDIMFIGGFLHQPNEDAVFYFVQEIFPLVKKKIPDMTFYVVGSDPSEKLMKLDSRDVKVTGYVPDVMPYFEDCRVFISPLRFGAGMKGKIGQSMGYGLPVVTTTIGAEGIGLTDGKNALIADNPADFADAIVKLYTDEILWENLSRESIALIEENYSKEIIRKKLKEVFRMKRQLQEA